MAKVRMAQYGTKHGHARVKCKRCLSTLMLKSQAFLNPTHNNAKNIRRMAEHLPMSTGMTMLRRCSAMRPSSRLLQKGNNAESLDQTEQIVNAGKTRLVRQTRRRELGTVAARHQYRPRKIPTRTDGLYATVSFRLQAGCRMGALRFFRRCFFVRSRPHVNQHLS